MSELRLGEIVRNAEFPNEHAATKELLDAFRGYERIVSPVFLDDKVEKDLIHLSHQKHDQHVTLVYEGPRFSAKVIERLLKMGLKDSHIYGLLTIPVPYGFLRRDYREMVIVRNQEEFDLLNQYTTFTEKLPDAPNPFPYLFGVEENEDYGSNVLSNMSLREGAEYFLELSKFLEKTKAIIERENETAIN